MNHEWTAIPYDESFRAGYHRQFAPYAWRCRVCAQCCRTTSEAEPSAENIGLRYREASPLDADCQPDSL